MASTVSYEHVLHRYLSVQEWLTLLDNLGRAPATLDAYGRGLAHYLLHCEASGLEAESITFEQVTLYIRRLLPGQENAVANSTLHQRLAAIRMWYDHLVFQGRCAQNPVPRGQHGRLCQVPGHSGFVRGLVPRLLKLPDIPTDEQWRYFLSIAARSSSRVVCYSDIEHFVSNVPAGAFGAVEVKTTLQDAVGEQVVQSRVGTLNNQPWQ
ncbi:Integrase/recombinase XerC [Pseudomonas syringae pv. apii]|uniref:Integrase/recombinase XerC n=1 Tax=Pseudomonas syringae pv. apii TaxID=81036 RepID=A0A3M5X447_9PSED|nr:Integrase/recombinase XerC [Pseudomonas syringae pv. apii]